LEYADLIFIFAGIFLLLLLEKCIYNHYILSQP